VVAGNVVLYGATAGECYVRGRAGERFAVRNSGAYAVVEGVGDHAAEYMTGGRVLILGAVGRNVAAGMSGGVLYVLDKDGGEDLRTKLNGEMVEIETLDDEHAEVVQQLLRGHVEATGSPVAERVLADFGLYREQIAVVMPRDYKRVLETRKRAEAEGIDVDLAVMAAVAG
jgi:glutamate synthase (NADPH/NADH) large chain